jgi:biotin operon repressor
MSHPSTAAGATQCDTILASLKLHQGDWVSLVHLATLSGSMAVHSRIADLRARGHAIDHKNERKGRMIHSSYRLVPTGPATQLDLL